LQRVVRRPGSCGPWSAGDLQWWNESVTAFFGTVPGWRGLIVPGPMCACSGPVDLLRFGSLRVLGPRVGSLRTLHVGPAAGWPDCLVLPGSLPGRRLARAGVLVWCCPRPAPGPGSCPSRGRIGRAQTSTAAWRWRSWVSAVRAADASGRMGLLSPCSACLRRVAGCRPVELAKDLGLVRCGPVLSGRKFQSHPGVPPARLIGIMRNINNNIAYLNSPMRISCVFHAFYA
jgi:hypothetical protein